MIKNIAQLSELLEWLDEYDAFIFDLDDTLYSEKEYVRSGYHAIAMSYHCIDNLEEKLWSAFESKEPAIDCVLRSEGITDARIKEEWLHKYRNQVPDIHLYPGVKDTLGLLKKSGKFLGMITDGRPEGQWAKIKALDVANYFDCIIVTDELGGAEYRKPNPTAFLKMKEAAGMEYTRMVYIGDNINKDFVAPETLGMGAIMIDNEDGLYRR